MLVKSQASAVDRRPGIDLHDLIGEMFPINRSLTGAGVRKTLGIIARHIDLDIHEVETGTAVLDWHVPKEWNIRSATIKTRNTPIGTMNQLWTWSSWVRPRMSADSALAPATLAVTLIAWYSPR